MRVKDQQVEAVGCNKKLRSSQNWDRGDTNRLFCITDTLGREADFVQFVEWSGLHTVPTVDPPIGGGVALVLQNPIGRTI